MPLLVASSTTPNAVGGVHVQRWLVTLPPILALFVVALATVDMLAWMVDTGPLVKKIPLLGAGAMMPLTAVGFLLLGGALLLLRNERSTVTPQGPLGRAMAATAALLGLLALLERVGGIDVGLESLLLEADLPWLRRPPGAPGPIASSCFVVVGSALVLLDSETVRGRRPSQFLVLLPGFLALQALRGYGYRRAEIFATEQAIVAIGGLTSMSVHTATLILAMALGTLLARPER